MTTKKNDPKSLSEAIERLENATHSKVDDFKNLLDKDYHEVRKALEDLKPILDGLRGKVETEAAKTKNQVEERIKGSPWMTIGFVGFIAFVVGCFIGHQNHKD
jgi:ElaB/YqjD/DUF883 family membrane-anchored ribosome-binding protein